MFIASSSRGLPSAPDRMGHSVFLENQQESPLPIWTPIPPVFGFWVFLGKLDTQCAAQPHDPEIKSHTFKTEPQPFPQTRSPSVGLPGRENGTSATRSLELESPVSRDDRSLFQPTPSPRPGRPASSVSLAHGHLFPSTLPLAWLRAPAPLMGPIASPRDLPPTCSP